MKYLNVTYGEKARYRKCTPYLGSRLPLPTNLEENNSVARSLYMYSLCCQSGINRNQLGFHQSDYYSLGVNQKLSYVLSLFTLGMSHLA